MAERTALEVVKFLEHSLTQSGLLIDKIVIFGSQATGMADVSSDIDVVIVSGDFAGKDIFERAELTKDAELESIRTFLVPLDILTLTPEEFDDETSLVSEYTKRGQVVYAA